MKRAIVLFALEKDRTVSALLLAIGLSGSLQASVCQTVANGDWDSPTTWGCGCLPGTCDTLIVSHDVSATGLTIIANDFISITNTGQLSTVDTLIFVRNVWNRGLIDVHFLIHSDTAQFLKNDGLLITGIASLYPDSIIQTGTWTILDLVYQYPGTRLYNSGTITGHTYQSMVGTNFGQIDLEVLEVSYLLGNEGSLTAQYLTAYGVLANDAGGYALLHEVLVYGMIDNEGQIDVTGHLWLGTEAMPSGELDVLFGTHVFVNGDLVNRGIMRGWGTVCVTGQTINEGLITDHLNFCDLSPSTTSPPFIDINTGTVGPGVNWCENAVCVNTLADQSGVQDIMAYPNPAWDAVTFTGNGLDRVRQVMVHDQLGREVAPGPVQLGNSIRVDRGELPAGVYVVRLCDQHDRPLLQTVVVFSEP
ncbi:MAG: T9SS type A sorting domain-containing protein [Flavobacteriales bacterium]|nr:T9SS type A sorting domain-containing protein [Flavobacteriales bacterium]